MKIKPLGNMVTLSKVPNPDERPVDEPVVHNMGPFHVVDVASLPDPHATDDVRGTMAKGIVLALGNMLEADALGFDVDDVVWYYQQAAINIGGTLLIGQAYILAAVVDGNDG